MKEIQECLGIGAYQSVYNWFSGKTLPSLDNMFALSRLLGISMENMIVCKDDNSKIADICYRNIERERRLRYYMELLQTRVA
ncbi:MAG: helix-turn-helix domain-containing protein [Clostridiales bacterium]|nr:helix-turn-helix domain-containing protein [Clostridiales bacterium]